MKIKTKKCFSCGRMFRTTTNARKCSNCKMEYQRSKRQRNKPTTFDADMKALDTWKTIRRRS